MAKGSNTFGGTIKLEGEKEYRKAISNINSDLKVLKSEMKLVTTEFGTNNKSVKALSEQNKILNQQIDNQKNKITTYKTALQDLNKQQENNKKVLSEAKTQYEEAKNKLDNMKNSTSATTEEIDKQEKEVEELKNALEKANNAYDNCDKKIDTWKVSLNNAEVELKNLEGSLKNITAESLINFGTSLESAGEKISNIGNKISVLSTATAGIGVKTVMTAANFEDAMRQVAATMGITSSEIENGSESYEILEKAAKDCGETTKYSASEAAEALNYLALAGYDAQKSAETLPKILNLAAAGNLDLATASDMVTDAMAALGMETSDLDKYIDEMAKTSQKSNTSVAQLGEATLTCAGTAKMSGMSLETMNAELGVLANNGIKGAEGGTHLRNIILSLTSPTDTAATALKSLGISVLDSSGNVRDMNDIMADFNKKLDGLSDGEKTNIISKIFNKTDISAVNALIKGSGQEFSDLKKEISNCNGAAQNMADTMNSSLKGQITLVKSQMESISITIGNKLMPSVKKAVSKISELADKFSKLSDNQVESILKIGAFVTAAGPLISILGKTTTAFGTTLKTTGNFILAMKNVATGVKVAEGQVGTFTTVLSALLSPAGLVALAIGGITTAVILYAEKQKEAQKTAEDFTQKMLDVKESFEDYNKSIDENAQKQLTEIEHISNLREELKNLVDENGNVKEGYKERVAFILNELNNALGTEYQLNGNIIESYQTLQQEIDKTIEKKKAEILLNAEEEKYRHALEEQANLVKTLKEAHDNLGMSYEDAKKKYDKFWEDVRKAVKDKDADTIHNLSLQKQEIDILGEKIKAYETAESTVNDCNSLIKEYEEDYANFMAGKYDEIGQTVVGETKSWSDKSLEEVRKGIDEQRKELNAYKEIAERTGDEVAKKHQENAEKNLKTLADELVARTSTVGTLGRNEIDAWQMLATSSFDIYKEEIQKMSPEMQSVIQSITGVIATNTTVSDEMKKLGEKSKKNYNDEISNVPNDTDSQLKSATTVIQNHKGMENAADTLGKNTVAKLNKKAEAEEAGRNIVDGATNGINNQNSQSLAFKAISTFGSLLLSRFRKALSEHSPSKETEQDGIYFVQGFMNGINKSRKDALNQISNFGTSLTNNFDSSLKIKGLNNANLSSVTIKNKIDSTTDLNTSKNNLDIDVLTYAFKSAIKDLNGKVVLDDEKMGKFVIETVEEAIY